MIELEEMKEFKRSFFSKKDFFAPKPIKGLNEPLISNNTDSGDPIESV
jgi:hypothetical protein